MPHQSNLQSNLQSIHSEFFRCMVECCLVESSTYYGERLAAAYVWGSVHRAEDVPGVSDLDLMLFVDGDVEQSDRDWRRAANDRLQHEQPGFGWGWLPIPIPLSRAPRAIEDHDEEPVRLRLRAGAYQLLYDATRVWGRDLMDGVLVTPPDRVWVRSALESPLALSRHAAEGGDNATDFTLSDDPALRFRKLARLAVLGGGYLLWAEGLSHSLEGSVALPILKQRHRQWSGFLEQTASRYIEPAEATPEQAGAYAKQLLNWMEWIYTQV